MRSAGDVRRAPPSDSAAEAHRGQLRDKPFPELFGEFHRIFATGALMLRREAVRKIVYFRDGAPEAVKSNLPAERLGRVLVHEGMITEAECETSLRRMKVSGHPQGTVLVSMGCISPQNLQHALRLQLQVKLWEIFRWDEGEYQFTRVEPPPVPVRPELSVIEALYEGIKRAFDPDRLGRVLGDLSGLCVLPAADSTEARREAGLGTDELRVWKAIDGRRTVGALARVGRLPLHETTALVWALRCAGLVEVKDPAALPPPLPRRPAPPPLQKRVAGRSAGTLLPELPSAPDELAAAEGRFRRGQELMGQEQYVEAWEHFEEAIRLYAHEGVFHAWLGWAIFQSAPASQKAIAAALEQLEKAIRLSPRDETGYLFSGYVHRAAGHPDVAREHFEKAVQCNPRCTEALHELQGVGHER
jgi:hypothetical protein